MYNGGFETGDLSDWTPFTTSNGTLGTSIPTVVPFTLNGTSTEVAQFEVGQTSFAPMNEQGGGIEQTVTATGNMVLSADVSFYNSSAFANAYAGEAILLIDNQAVATFNAGAIDPGQLITDTLSYSFVDTGQPITVGLEFLRPATSANGVTPYQMIDGIDLEDPSGLDTSTPEPGTWVLAGVPLALALWKRRKVKLPAMSI